MNVQQKCLNISLSCQWKKKSSHIYCKKGKKRQKCNNFIIIPSTKHYSAHSAGPSSRRATAPPTRVLLLRRQTGGSREPWGRSSWWPRGPHCNTIKMYVSFIPCQLHLSVTPQDVQISGAEQSSLLRQRLWHMTRERGSGRKGWGKQVWGWWDAGLRQYGEWLDYVLYHLFHAKFS